MLISNAYAQTAAPAGGGMEQIFIMIAMFAVFYFLMIRPQQKKAKEHRAMVEAVRRGDMVITAGGIVGKVAKVKEDGEVEVEIAEGIKVRVIRSTISQVISRTEPATTGS